MYAVYWLIASAVFLLVEIMTLGLQVSGLQVEPLLQQSQHYLVFHFGYRC